MKSYKLRQNPIHHFDVELCNGYQQEIYLANFFGMATNRILTLNQLENLIILYGGKPWWECRKPSEQTIRTSIRWLLNTWVKEGNLVVV